MPLACFLFTVEFLFFFHDIQVTFVKLAFKKVIPIFFKINLWNNTCIISNENTI